MAYNPYSAVNAIYNLKGEWDKANNAGDTATKNSVAKRAQTYYNQLRSNDYGDLADQLSSSNYTQAKAIKDKLTKMDKTSTRDYFYSLGQKYGMNSSDVDKLISWDNDTKQVSFGGKVVGTPDALVDGVSYWGDTSVLDNAFNDYVSRTGTTRSAETAVNQENEGLFAKYNQEYEDLKKTNPFTTDEAKAILGKYDLAGLQARDNAVASGGATNGGNIDSYAAANAMRQQASLVNQGQMAVLEAHQQKIDNVRNLLSDMGVNIDRVFNQDQTSKNNETARLEVQAGVTGYTPNEWIIKNDDIYSQFLNEDGTFKKEKEGVDIQALINQTTDPETKKKLAVVRTRKILGNYGEFGKYSNVGDISSMTPQQTEAGREFDIQADISKQALTSEEKIAAANNQNTLDQIEANKNANLELAKAGVKTDKNGNVVVDENQQDKNWTTFKNYFYDDDKITNFLTKELKPYFDSGQEINEDVLKELIVGADGKCGKDSGTYKYAIKVEDARNIISKLNSMLASINPNATPLDASWLDDYKNRIDVNDDEGMKLQ